LERNEWLIAAARSAPHPSALSKLSNGIALLRMRSMRIDLRIPMHGIIGGVALLLCGAGAFGASPTAFELIKEGNKHVGEEAKDRVVEIRSEKSVGSLVPDIWYVVYYDPDASLKATEVKFGAGKKLTVKRPPRLLEPITRSHRELPRQKLKVDSDKAINTATKDDLLKNLKLTNTQLWLENSDDGPRWKVRLWAEKIRNPTSTAEIGQIYISAEDGKVLERDLHTNRVD
jgi:hypothetical protein